MLEGLTSPKVRFLIKVSLIALFFVSLNGVGSKNFVYAQACTNPVSGCEITPCCTGYTCTPFPGTGLPSACLPNTTPLCGIIGNCGGTTGVTCSIGSLCTATGCQVNATACPGNYPNGSTCTTGTQCASGYCNPSSHVCTSSAPVILPPGSPVIIADIIEIGPLFGALASILIPGGIALALIRIAWAGYEFMTSEGNPQKVEEAREDLTAAIIGAIFILLSVVILRVILNSFLGSPGF